MEGKTRPQAKNCDLLLLTNSKHQVLCNECSSIKHNSFYHRLQLSNSTTTSSNKKFKRESYMSVDEKLAKLSEETNRGRKAEKRESYLREKIEKGMKEFGEEDNKDFTDMMNLVEENMKDDMKLFFKIQRENLGKSPIRDTGAPNVNFSQLYYLFVQYNTDSTCSGFAGKNNKKLDLIRVFPWGEARRDFF